MANENLDIEHVDDEDKCLICLDLAYPPVSFPCHHRTCEKCFQHVETTCNLTCPVCRKRLHSWARRLRGKIVDIDLKSELQDRYPKLCKHLDSGEEVELPDDEPMEHYLSHPGEIRDEYMQLVHEIEQREKEEEKLSMQLIEKLQQEEEEERKRREAHDARIARRLSQELGDIADEPPLKRNASSSPSSPSRPVTRSSPRKQKSGTKVESTTRPASTRPASTRSKSTRNLSKKQQSKLKKSSSTPSSSKSTTLRKYFKPKS